jgi:hypothetical protein
MPTTVLYRKQWDEFGEGLRLDIIPRSNAALPGGYSVVTLPDDFLISWKVSGAKFPSDRPWGLHQVPSLVVDANMLALTGSTALTDLDTYLQDPIYPAGGSVAIGDGSETFDTSNIWVLWSDNGTNGAAWECIFVGAQRLIPGEEEEIIGAGEATAIVKTTFTIAHAALYTLESIPTDWLARRAISQETPLGPFENAFNLIYYDTVTGRVFALVESTTETDGPQEFFLYSAQDMFGQHMAYLATQVYIDLMRGAYDVPTVTMKGYHTGDGGSTNGSPVMVPLHFKPDYSVDYDINADDPDPIAELYVKGVINDSSDDTTLGGWYSVHSEKSVYQWTHCWDMFAAHCDTAKSAIYQVDPAALEFHFMPLYMDAPDGSAVSVTLTSTDVHGAGVKRNKQKGAMKGASVECPTSGGDDKGTHPIAAKGIRSEEETTLSLALTNQIPLPDDIGRALLPHGVNAAVDGFPVLALTPTLSTNTLYFVDTPTFTLVGSEVLTDDPVPILAAPQVHIYGGLSYTYSGGYDMSACTPLPTATSATEYNDAIQGAVIAIQQNAGLPHVLANYIVEEFGAGHAANIVHYEMTVGRPLLQKVRMKHLGLWIAFDAALLLPGSTRYDNDPPESCLYDWAPGENGTATLKLIGYTRNT